MKTILYVLRGGAFFNVRQICHYSVRDNAIPDYRNYGRSFRIIKRKKRS